MLKYGSVLVQLGPCGIVMEMLVWAGWWDGTKNNIRIWDWRSLCWTFKLVRTTWKKKESFKASMLTATEARIIVVWSVSVVIKRCLAIVLHLINHSLRNKLRVKQLELQTRKWFIQRKVLIFFLFMPRLFRKLLQELILIFLFLITPFKQCLRPGLVEQVDKDDGSVHKTDLYNCSGKLLLHLLNSHGATTSTEQWITQFTICIIVSDKK